MDNYNYHYDMKKGSRIPAVIRNNIWKIVIAIALIVVVIVLINSCSSKKKYETPCGEDLCIELNGDTTMTIYDDMTFDEPGYTAYDAKYGDITDLVEIEGEVDETVPGTYHITYSVKNRDKLTAEETRTVIVTTRKEDTIYELTITLEGESTITLEQGTAYEEPGYTAYDETEGVVTSKVVVSNNVDINTPGTYEIVYVISNNDKSAEAIRTVIITAKQEPPVTPPSNPQPTYNVSITATASPTELTNNNVTVTVSAKGNGFNYILLPNNTKIYKTTATYTVTDNGTYTFIAYDKNNKASKTSITISNIDKTGPTGTCTGVIEKGKTIVRIMPTDSKEIGGYIFKGAGITSSKVITSSYVFYSATTDVSVTLFDKIGNQNVVKCTISS